MDDDKRLDAAAKSLRNFMTISAGLAKEITDRDKETGNISETEKLFLKAYIEMTLETIKAHLMKNSEQ